MKNRDKFYSARELDFTGGSNNDDDDTTMTTMSGEDRTAAAAAAAPTHGANAIVDAVDKYRSTCRWKELIDECDRGIADTIKGGDLELKQKLLWRRARARVNLTDQQGADPHTRGVEYQKALDDCHTAREINRMCPDAAVAEAIAAGRLQETLGKADRHRAVLAKVIKESCEDCLKGVEKGLGNSVWDCEYVCHEVIGKWHLNVATQGFANKMILKAIFLGNFPHASTQDARTHFEAQLAMKPEMNHPLLEIAHVDIAEKKKNDARERVKTFLETSKGNPFYEEHVPRYRKEAEELLATLG